MLNKISIILPVYNCEGYIHQSIDSILAQSYQNFELIIFNDASTDSTLDIINTYKDSRIRLINSPENKGYVAHLNHGLNIARGKYIARMDADDVCMPDRLKKQISFLEQNPNYDICGTWVEPIGASNDKNIWKLPSTHNSIIIHQFFYNTALAHPTVMLRKSFVDEHNLRYNHNFMPAEDYELWTRISKLTKFKNISTPLLKYRQHPHQISQVKKDQKQAALKKIRSAQLQLLDIIPTQEELDISLIISNRKFSHLSNHLIDVKRWLTKLHESNQKLGMFDQFSFKQELGYLWWMICTCTARSNRKNTIKLYSNSPLSSFYLPTKSALLKFYIKSYFGF